MKVWDYQIPKNWQPTTDKEWEWFLVRKINYGDFKTVNRTRLKKHFPNIKNYLDPAKRTMIEHFLYGVNN